MFKIKIAKAVSLYWSVVLEAVAITAMFLFTYVKYPSLSASERQTPAVIMFLCIVLIVTTVDIRSFKTSRKLKDLFLTLGVSESNKNNSAVFPKFVYFKWRNNRSQLHIFGYREGIQLKDFEAAKLSVENILKAHILKIDHLPSTSAVVFHIDRTPAVANIEEMEKVRSDHSFSGIMGLSSEGQPVLFRYDNGPVLDIRGATGSGKSEAAKAIVLSILKREKRPCKELVIIDPKSPGPNIASRQFEPITEYCKSNGINFSVINPDQTNLNTLSTNASPTDDFSGLVEVRSKLAEIHAEYKALASKTEAAPFYYLLLAEEASSYADPSAKTDKTAKTLVQDICTYLNIWARLYRSSVFGPMVLVTQNSKADSIQIDLANLQYRLLAKTGTPQASHTLIGSDLLYRDATFHHGKFFCIASPEGYSGPLRTLFHKGNVPK